MAGMLWPSSPSAWGAGDPFRGLAWIIAASSTRHGQARSAAASSTSLVDETSEPGGLGSDDGETGIESGAQLLPRPCAAHSAAELHRAARGGQGAQRAPVRANTKLRMHPRGIRVHRRVEKTTRTALLQPATGPRSTGPHRRLARRRRDRLQAK